MPSAHIYLDGNKIKEKDMINVTKITNKDDSFLVNYWSGNGQETLLVNASNIVEELNTAFATIQKANEEQRKRDEAHRAQYGSGLLGANPCVPSASIASEVKEAA